jgi:hypothetical protein
MHPADQFEAFKKLSEERGLGADEIDLLVTAKAGSSADALRHAEGRKWTKAHLDFPDAHGMRLINPHPVELSIRLPLRRGKCTGVRSRITKWVTTLILLIVVGFHLTSKWAYTRAAVRESGHR